MLVDSHAHLNFAELLSDLDSVLEYAKQNGVEKIISVGTSVEDSLKNVELVKKYENVFATVGIHPNDDLGATEDSVDWYEIESLAGNEKVVAIGECGLDYSRLTGDHGQEKIRQKKLFKRQIELATKLKLPISVHLRDAQEDLMNEFGALLTPISGVFHCFSGDEKYLDFILKSLPNFCVSFAGNLTYKNSHSIRELARLTPLEKILVETDCPFLSPEPMRGTRNEPGNVKITATVLAEIKGASFSEIAEVTSENVTRLFKI